MAAMDSAILSGEQSGDARERLLAAAYELFSRRGVQAVGIDAIIERSGVARQTMYRHFASKQDLVLAFLERRQEVWTGSGSGERSFDCASCPLGIHSITIS